MDWESFYNNFRKPDFIQGYEIEHRLGGGAFGEVYKAHKPSIEKSFAIKFLKVEDGAKERIIERELEQVRHFASIDHPNLVTIEDMGAVLGVPYLIMGYAGEVTLARRISQGQMSHQQAMSLFVQTCRGVLALHDRRLVHFDLKPGNVFIHGDVARVGDYGLSKLMTEGRMTLSFGRGTPHYMAPEMLKERADHRADIYSLGVILFECVSGSVPYDVKSNVGIVMRDKDTPPEFPSDFPGELRAVVERCLRLAPEDRYESVEELLGDLGQTARRGDSIRIEPGFPESTAGRIATEVNAARAAAQAPAASSGELRATAAELTRGAVEVARGVWDGLRTAKGPSRIGENSEGTPTPMGAPGAFGATQQATPMDAEPSPIPVAPRPAFPSGATVPVPPKVEGSSFGVVFAAIALAVEVFLSLVGGILRRSRDFLQKRNARMRARSKNPIGLIFRFAIFYSLLLLAGSVVLSIVVASLQQ
jgi:hypothetical protein